MTRSQSARGNRVADRRPDGGRRCARARARAAHEQPMVSRSGIDLAALDKSANPCDDFYQFACGGWIKKHPAPPDQPRYGRFDELQERNNAILRDILDEAAKPGAAPELKKIGDYYASCMDGSRRSRPRARRRSTPDLAARRRDQGQGRASRGRRPHATVGMSALLRVRRRARLQGRDAVHADLRPGRARAARSRLLPERRRRRRRSCAPSTSSTSAEMLQLGGDTPAAAAAGREDGPGDRDGAREERARPRQRGATRPTSTTRCRATRSRS